MPVSALQFLKPFILDPTSLGNRTKRVRESGLSDDPQCTSALEDMQPQSTFCQPTRCRLCQKHEESAPRRIGLSFAPTAPFPRAQHPENPALKPSDINQGL